MNRKIKFRLWDKVNKRFISIDDNSNLDFAINTKGHLYSIEHSYCETYVSPQTDIEVSEYTGLQDKNGKDIYEGDILKNIHNNKLTRVEWIGSYAGFVHEYVDKSINKYCYPHNLHLCYMKMEVIGNRFENPELLNVKIDETDKKEV